MDTAFINKLMILNDKDYDVQMHHSLSRTIEKYPYFSLLYYYYAKGSKTIGQNINHNLSLASLYSPDRKRLQDFLDEKIAFQFTTETPLASNMDKINAKIEELKKLYPTAPQLLTNNHVNDIIKEIDSYSEPDVSSTPTKAELVERFIRIENPKVKNFEQDKVSQSVNEVVKKSVADEYEIVTETMAKVYIKQGNYDKGIKIYRQLILANPEKSIYFANQIKNIEEKNK